MYIPAIHSLPLSVLIVSTPANQAMLPPSSAQFRSCASIASSVSSYRHRENALRVFCITTTTLFPSLKPPIEAIDTIDPHPPYRHRHLAIPNPPLSLPTILLSNLLSLRQHLPRPGGTHVRLMRSHIPTCIDKLAVESGCEPRECGDRM